MRRREFFTLLGGITILRPLTAWAQQSERSRRIGILMPLRENDPQSQLRIAAFSQVLRQIGWVEGQTIAFENRFQMAIPNGYLSSLRI
jgi:putative ABC transport system substrate-binding protein